MAIKKKIILNQGTEYKGVALKKGSLYIWLDDRWNDPDSKDRRPPEGWMPVADFSELKSLVERAIRRGISLGGLSFDNDLGDGKKEGHKCAEWIVQGYPEWFGGDEFLEVHTDNPSARPRIEGHFRDVRERRRELMEMKMMRESGKLEY